MEWVVGVLVLIGLVAVALKKNIAQKKGSELTIKYQTVDSLLSPTEQKFLKVLDSVVDDRVRVFSMVRVADVIKPAKSLDSSIKRKLFLKTSQKHFDFVICDSITLMPLCVIELNDKSHRQKKRKERDGFLAEACKSAALPLKFVEVAKSYNQSELAMFLNAAHEQLVRKAA